MGHLLAHFKYKEYQACGQYCQHYSVGFISDVAFRCYHCCILPLPHLPVSADYLLVQVSMTMTTSMQRSLIVIPAQGLIEIRDTLTDLLKEFGTDNKGSWCVTIIGVIYSFYMTTVLKLLSAAIIEVSVWHGF